MLIALPKLNLIVVLMLAQCFLYVQSNGINAPNPIVPVVNCASMITLSCILHFYLNRLHHHTHGVSRELRQVHWTQTPLVIRVPTTCG